MFDDTNAQRAMNGVAPPLVLDPQLEAAARDHAANNASHGALTHDYVNPDGSSISFYQWIPRYCQGATGENLAQGYPASSVVGTGWMNSPGHRANILNPGWTRIGVAAINSGTWWAAQDFSAAPC